MRVASFAEVVCAAAGNEVDTTLVNVQTACWPGLVVHLISYQNLLTRRGVIVLC